MAAVVAFIAIGGAAIKAGASGTTICVASILVIFVLMLAAIVLIILKQPELAVLEGMELVHYKRVTIGAKGFNPEKELPPVPDPKLLDAGEEDK